MFFFRFHYRDGNASESEGEEDENSQVVLPQTLKRKGNLENNKSAVQLHEIGPRMTMQLMKIEEGLLTGEVLYHDHIIKTEEEKEELRKQIEKKQKLKEQRKKQQAENRAKKLKELEKKNKNSKHNQDSVAAADNDQDGEQQFSDLEDDAVYYKEEVGEEPDEELFKSTEPASRKRPKLPYSLKNNKKPRLEGKSGDPAKKKKDYKDKKSFKDTKKGFKNGFKEKKSFKFNKKK